MDKKKLIIARNKIDQLDNSIFNLITKRTKVVKHMLGLKRYKNQIVDHKRINTILKNIRKKSMRHRIILQFIFRNFFVEIKIFIPLIDI